MDNIVPIIDRITESNGLFYALNKEGEVIFVTEHPAIAEMYYTVPRIVAKQADIIKELTTRLDQQAEAQNQAIMEIIPCGSYLIH